MGRLLAWAVHLLPPGRRELGRALLAEASAVAPGRRRAAWLAGGVWFVVRESAMRLLGYWLGLPAAVAALVIVDKVNGSDDAGPVSLLVLLASAAVLGFVAPRRAWLAGLVLGSALAVVGLVGAAFGAHLQDPGGAAGAATLFVLIVPALVGAYLGAAAAWLLRRARA